MRMLDFETHHGKKVWVNLATIQVIHEDDNNRALTNIVFTSHPSSIYQVKGTLNEVATRINSSLES